jgi:hypothetical protein
MNRRLLLSALAGAMAGHAVAQAADARPRHTISAAQLHKALSERFPVRSRLGGIADLEVSAPQLLLLPRRDLLGATLVAELRGAGVDQAQAGEADVVFRLRYEPADQSVRAHALEILALRLPGVPPETTQLLKRLLPGVARETVGEVVLHKLGPRELATADAMGYEPESFDVTAQGVVVVFGPKGKAAGR